MLKKIIKLATVLSLLGATHIAYVQAFSFVVQRLRSARPTEDTGFEIQDSQTKRVARDISREAFGPGHWTDSDKLLRYYNSHRGFFLYTLKFARPTEEGGVKFDGKRVTLEPAAVVLRSPDGKSTKTVTSERAILDFNQSFGFNLNKTDSEPTTIKYARLERNVMIRDDRGTPDDPSDDLVIGPISYVDYDDETLQIRTDADVTLVDRDLRLTGTGLEIQLRAKDQPGIGATTHANGFNGAQRAILKKNIHMLFADVGRAGLLPGTAKTTDAEGQTETAAVVPPNPNNEPTPLDLQCDGPMIVEMPSSPPPVEVGPPAPPAPTFVEFQRNVVVRRGKLSVDPDQLNCDTLHLTLLPGEPKPPPKDEAGPSAVDVEPQIAAAETPGAPVDEEKSAFGGLTLRRAKASGHAVWLQLPGQGAKIRCVELLHHKDAVAGKNTTIFHGGGPRKLWVEKRDIAQDGPNRGQVESVTHVWCADATLMDEGDMDRATLVANGPGLLESRGGAEPPRDAPPDRTVTWQDQLWLQNEVDAANAITGKVLVLKGSPRVQDRTKGASLDARDSIVVWLNAEEPKPEGAIKTADARDVVPAAFTVAEGEAAAPAQQPAKESDGLSIRRLLAVKDVHLVAPARDLRTREVLDVNFERATVTTTPSGGTVKPTSGPAPAAKPAPPAEPPLDPNAPANSNAGDQSANPPKPDEPLMTALADRALAKVVIGPGAEAATAGAVPLAGEENSSYEIRDVELRGGVALHQDPHPGKDKGLDATGEVLILLNEGPGKAIFDLYHHDPYSPKGRDADPEALPRARVSTDDMTIEAKVIGLNQKTNEAWAKGAGKLVQMTDRALLTDRAAETPEPGEPRADDAKNKTRAGKPLADKTPIVITWDEKMTFQGVAADPLNRPAAKAKFYKNARAEMRDALLYGGESITTYTDRPIPLAEAGKLNQKPDAANANANAETDQPKPDLALIECEGRAVAISRKVDADRPVLLGMQKITANSLTYDRRSGGFIAPGPGLVYLYDRGEDPLKSQDGAVSKAPIATSRVVRPIAYQAGGEDEKVAVRHADAARPAPERPQSLLPPLVLTQIKFEREMRGRLGTGKADDVTEQRWAEFFGGVETARGEVSNERTVFNYDHLPANASFMTSEMLRVVTEPPPPGEARNSGGRYFLKAWDNAYVTARDTTLQADVITYDSLNDLIYANGLDGRPVQIVQQAAVGQPGSPLRVAAVRMNPRTGAADVIDPQALQLVDAHTGARPKVVPPPNPNAGPAAKRPTRPKRPPVNPAEIRGFTGR